jgi:DNA-binding protein
VFVLILSCLIDLNEPQVSVISVVAVGNSTYFVAIVAVKLTDCQCIDPFSMLFHQESPGLTVTIAADGPAIPKAVTVIEIIKRTSDMQIHQQDASISNASAVSHSRVATTSGLSKQTGNTVDPTPAESGTKSAPRLSIVLAAVIQKAKV